MNFNMESCFRKALSNSDVTSTILEVPKKAANLPENNKASMVVKDHTGREWIFLVVKKNDRKRLQGEWGSFTKTYHLKKDVIVDFYYTPTSKSYYVEFEGHHLPGTQHFRGWRINLSVKRFEKEFSKTDVTNTLEIPMTAACLLEDNHGIMVAWDQTGMFLKFQMEISADNRKILNREQWHEFANHHGMEEGETLKIYYCPTHNSYIAEFQGPKRLPTLPLFPPN